MSERERGRIGGIHHNNSILPVPHNYFYYDGVHNAKTPFIYFSGCLPAAEIHSSAIVMYSQNCCSLDNIYFIDIPVEWRTNTLIIIISFFLPLPQATGDRHVCKLLQVKKNWTSITNRGRIFNYVVKTKYILYSI